MFLHYSFKGNRFFSLSTVIQQQRITVDKVVEAKKIKKDSLDPIVRSTFWRGKGLALDWNKVIHLT